jgi:hypothetical protein
MIDQAWAQRFAEEWIEAWNAHDLPRILSHYADDFEMASPFIVERMQVAEGILRGKAAIIPYWQKGLDASPPLHFDLIAVFVGVNSLVLHYRRATGTLAAETLIFNAQGLVVQGIAHYAEHG